MTPPATPKIDQDLVDALGALGNRSRLEILLALAEAERDQQEQWLYMSFTELYDTIDFESTSQFSYHLDRLVGPFVAEAADGYRLTYAGDKIVRTIVAGLYENTRRFDDTDVDGVCVFCGTDSLVAAVAKSSSSFTVGPAIRGCSPTSSPKARRDTDRGRRSSRASEPVSGDRLRCSKTASVRSVTGRSTLPSKRTGTMIGRCTHSRVPVASAGSRSTSRLRR
jgi:DNA-binding transcriptional ArsR family regulator